MCGRPGVSPAGSNTRCWWSFPKPDVPIYGLNYKDKREDAIGWLNKFGNPYTRSVSDSKGLVGIDFGVYGVPETFVIDKSGVIRFKQIGPVTPEVLRDDILPLLRKLGA